MASKSGEPSLSNYYSGLDNTAKERYMDKLRLINKIDPYCRMESKSKKSLPGPLELDELARCPLCRYLLLPYSFSRYVS